MPKELTDICECRVAFAPEKHGFSATTILQVKAKF